MKRFLKHQYVSCKDEQSEANFIYTIRQCEYCGQKTTLSLRQLESNPSYLAKCEKGKKASIIEMMFGLYNCLLPKEYYFSERKCQL